MLYVLLVASYLWWMGALEKEKAANLIALDSYPFDDLHLLAHKKHLRFVMKAGKLAACHADYDLPRDHF